MIDKNSVSIRKADWRDIDYYFQWRNNPKIYKYFKEQNSKLEWCNHVSYWKDNLEYTYTILLYNSPVGYIKIDPDKEISILIGNCYLWNKGIATIALELIMERYNKPFYATIHKDNNGSIRLFEKFGFEKVSTKDNWLEYKLE